MSEIAKKEAFMPGEKYAGHLIIEAWSFNVNGTFQSFYAANKWCHDNNYEYGSLCIQEPVAMQRYQYDLPQKWKNFDNEDIKAIDGVMISNDFREGGVVIYIFN